jgi:hypothetical protein
MIGQGEAYEEDSMRKIIAVGVLLALAGPALAQGRPLTTRMTCARAAALVAQRGAIVLGTGGQLYDRYVSSQVFCPTGLYARAAFVPTADNPQCYIGYYCSSAPPLFRW